jgi:uncharacterized protein (DUF2336 family)
MAEYRSFLADLEDAVANGTAESCLRALWHATDVLIAGSYSEEQISTFGEIIGCLAEEIEISARARLASKLAASNNAPLAVVRILASDDSIEVAGPILHQSERIDTQTLIACATNKGQEHLLAITKRNSIPESVTDVLVIRGSKEVVTSIARNSGARFSNAGFLHLVRRSEGDLILTECVGIRRDIPRHLFHQLISKASDEVKTKLARSHPEMASEIHSIVADATGPIHARFGPASKNYFTARRTVAKLYQGGELTEDKLFEFAHSLKFNETAVALSLLCSVPIDVVERALVDKNRESLLILAKALGFSWTTTMSLLFLGAPNYRITAGDLDRMKIDFLKLNVDTCLRVLAVYRSRKTAAANDSHG